MSSKAVWLRIVPIVMIALAATGLCLQAACSNDDKSGYGYDDDDDHDHNGSSYGIGKAY